MAAITDSATKWPTRPFFHHITFCERQRQILKVKSRTPCTFRLVSQERYEGTTCFLETRHYKMSQCADGGGKKCNCLAAGPPRNLLFVFSDSQKNCGREYEAAIAILCVQFSEKTSIALCRSVKAIQGPPSPFYSI